MNNFLLQENDSVGVYKLQHFSCFVDARIRRFLTPVLFGSAATAYVYKEKTSSWGQNIFQSSWEKIVNIKKRATGRD